MTIEHRGVPIPPDSSRPGLEDCHRIILKT